MLGGIEAGGTKFICVLGEAPDRIVETERIEVTAPGPTIDAAIDFFRGATARGRHLDAIGIASFGPVELRREQPRYGWITTTPKAGWSETDLVGAVGRALAVPIGFDTDVNAAALAEGRYGAARGLRDFVYLTIGTGIGGGVVADGRVLHGLGHPEIGHVAVRRRPGDTFPGSCPFHGDCLEGMASGSALAARFGRRGEDLPATERGEAASIVAFYLAAGIATLIYTLAPERIIVGGGLSTLPGLVTAAHAELGAQLAGYACLPEHGAEEFIVTAGLGEDAGPIGSLLLASAALAGGS